MGGNIFVSFIVVCYNLEATIGRCLESIQNIDYPRDKFEIIVSDNGSKDSTVDIARRFTDKVFVIPDVKVAQLRNFGARDSKGEILVFIDGDCVISKDWLISALEHFKDNKVGLAGSKSYILPDQASWIEKAWRFHLLRGQDSKEARWVVSRLLAMRRDIFLSVSGFNESLTTAEDVDLGYRINRNYKIICDERLAPLHLKLTNSLLGFFKQETWRGRDSLRVSFKYMNESSELLSVATLLYYFLLLSFLVPSTIITIFTKNLFFIIASLIGIISPAIIVSFDTCLRSKKMDYFWKIFVLYNVYNLARLWAILKFYKK